MSTRDLVLAALFTAIIIVLGLIPPVPVPVIPVPITAQSMGVMLAGCIIGAKRGALACVLLVVLVAVGLPILPGGRGGLAALMGPTAGYIVGYIAGSFVTGLIAQYLVREGQSDLVQISIFLLASIVGGIAVVYALGIPWLAHINNMQLGAAAMTNVPFLPGDVLKAIIASLAARAVMVGYPLLPQRA